VSGNALNGNLPANRIQLSQALSGANWGNGDFLWIRWTSQVNPPFNVSHGLAIDNFAFSATAVPEPSSLLLLATAGSALGLLFRRKIRVQLNGASAVEFAE